MTVLKGFLIVLALFAIFAFIIYALMVAVQEDNADILDMTDEELAEERSRYACYEDTDIES